MIEICQELIDERELLTSALPVRHDEETRYEAPHLNYELRIKNDELRMVLHFCQRASSTAYCRCPLHTHFIFSFPPMLSTFKPLIANFTQFFVRLK